MSEPIQADFGDRCHKAGCNSVAVRFCNGRWCADHADEPERLDEWLDRLTEDATPRGGERGNDGDLDNGHENRRQNRRWACWTNARA